MKYSQDTLEQIKNYFGITYMERALRGVNISKLMQHFIEGYGYNLDSKGQWVSGAWDTVKRAREEEEIYAEQWRQETGEGEVGKVEKDCQ